MPSSNQSEQARTCSGVGLPLPLAGCRAAQAAACASVAPMVSVVSAGGPSVCLPTTPSQIDLSTTLLSMGEPECRRSSGRSCRRSSSATAD